MNREVFEKIVGFVSVNNYPVLPCPYCLENELVINNDTLNYELINIKDCNSSIVTKEYDENLSLAKDIYEENKFFGVLATFAVGGMLLMEKHAKFICFFTCNNCMKSVSSTGTLKLDRDENIDRGSMKIEYFSPPIPIFKLSDNIPIDIRNELIQVFNHFHADLNSSGAKLRRAIEKLCLDLGFKEKNLHFTITKMKDKYPVESELLDSLKLLGNEATHSDAVTENDLLDALEVMDYVLSLYNRKKELQLANEKALKLKEKFKKPILILNN